MKNLNCLVVLLLMAVVMGYSLKMNAMQLNLIQLNQVPTERMAFNSAIELGLSHLFLVIFLVIYGGQQVLSPLKQGQQQGRMQFSSPHGGARWLELNLDMPSKNIAGFVSVAALFQIGLILMFYREPLYSL